MYNEEMEKAMLCHIIFNEYDSDLTEDDFIGSLNKQIMRAITELKQRKEEISIISIEDRIDGDGEQVLRYLATLSDYAIGTNPDDLYNKIVKLSQKRDIFKMLQQKLIILEDTPIEETVNGIESEIKAIMQRNEKQDTFIEQLSKTVEQIEKNYNDRNDYSLYTGLTDLDDKTLGLHNGELTIIGARPGVGKTTFALQIAQRIAKENKKVAIISLEMSDVQLIQKIISKKSSVNSYRMRSGNLEDGDWKKIAEAIGEISELPLKIITNALNIQKIERVIRNLKNKDELDLVVIDYIQLIKNRGRFNNREQEVADISRTLKLLSLELNIPIIALCQLNRNANQSEPTLADLRESGSIEQDADNVLFLYQEKEQETPVVDVTLKIAKQRTGEIGKIYLKFNKPNSEFIGIVRW